MIMLTAAEAATTYLAVDIPITPPPGADRYIRLLGVAMWVIAGLATAAFLWGAGEVMAARHRAGDTSDGWKRIGMSSVALVVAASAGSIVGFVTGWSF